MGLHIDYYASLNSPWTHLGAARIEAMAMAHDATLRIYPVDFGAIFSQSGGLPLPQRSPQRRFYRMQELARWRDHLEHHNVVTSTAERQPTLGRDRLRCDALLSRISGDGCRYGGSGGVDREKRQGRQ